MGFLCSVLSAEEYGERVFVSKDGRMRIVATPIGYDVAGSLIYLRKKDGKILKVDPSKFNVNDQLFIEDNKELLGQMFRWMKMPSALKSRYSKIVRERLVKQYQMPDGSEVAVEKFMQWLKKTQNADGSWTEPKKVAMTALSLLVYLGHGESVQSKEYGDSIRQGIDYLVKIGMQQRGKLADDVKVAHWPYEHAMATMALAEAQMTCKAQGVKIPHLDLVTKAAGDWILKHQHVSGSWEYRYDKKGKRGGDVSIAAWHVQAIRMCQLTGLWEKSAFKLSVKKSLEYVKSKQNVNGGVGYSSPNPRTDNGYTLTGVPMLAFQMCGKPHDSLVRKGARYIRKNVSFKYDSPQADLYAHYYYALAMRNRGRGDWDFYNKMLGRQLVDNQREDGSWKDVGGGVKVKAHAPQYQGETAGSVHYRGCLCALMLEVPYRYVWESATR